MDTKAPSLETLPEEVLQCVLQHVPFKDRNGIAAGECVVRIVPEDNWRRHELMLPWASHELLPERFWNGL
ncbi:hypothetical protein WJX82_002969 [Trebouxia sp. C0006]